MMELPPGIQFLSSNAPPVLLPLLAVYAVHQIAVKYFEQDLANWIVLSSYIFCLPVVFTVSVIYTKIKDERTAASLGAILPPTIPGDPTPGGILTLSRAVRNFKNEYPAEALEPVFQSLGYTVNMRILFENRIFTAEPEYIKAVLATKFDDFEKGVTTRLSLGSLLGTGVFNADGDLWKFHRGITRPFFSKDRISHFDIFDRHAEVAISHVKKRLKEGFPVDFQDVIARFTLDSATEFLFGKDIETLSGTLPYPYYSPQAKAESNDRETFAQSFNGAQLASAFRVRTAQAWPLFEFWKDEVREKIAPVHEFLEPILVEALRRHREKNGTAEHQPLRGEREVKEGDTVLDHLVNYTDDLTIIRDEILNLAVAGRDTTASLLTFTVYMLSEHPQVLHRLREEILTKIGPDRRPTYDDFREMKYLRAVFNEVMRLYPPVPFNMRQVANKKGVVVPGLRGGKSLYLPPTARVIFSVFVMHRRTDLWGPDALEFDPDRFIDERLHKYLTPNPFIFLPFNAGPRICLGQQFAYHEASFFLVRLLQNFSDISFNSEAQPPNARPPPQWKEEGGYKAREKVQIKSHLTMYIPEGLWVSMSEAQD